MANRWHIDWLREGVKSWNARRKKIKFIPDLSGLNFFEILPEDYRDAPKTSRYFEKIDLSGANLYGANLSNLNFWRARFDEANLTKALLEKSNFSESKFSNAKIEKASFFRSNLKKSIFKNTLLSETDFRESEIEGAVFEDSILSDKGLKNSLIERSRTQKLDHRSISVSHVNAIQAIKSEVNNITTIEEFDTKNKVADNRLKEIEKTKKNRYDVFYCTNRSPIVQRGKIVDFDSKRSENVSFGVCEVIVPDGHKIGSLGSPQWKRLFNRKDDRLSIESLISLNQELFWNFLAQLRLKSRNPEKPTVFVHGFNNSFQNSVLRAAQIGYDLGIGQGIGLFSWPSKGRKRDYLADSAAADSSRVVFANFLEDFIANTEYNSINIIAHSMGCRVVMGAFEALSAANKKSIIKSVNQVILAAADVDTQIMSYLAPYIVPYCKRVTSYASLEDKALKLSKWLHDFPRAGLTPPTFVFSGMDTIVVNQAATDLFWHNYATDNRFILSDIFSILKNNLPPEQRHAIEKITEHGITYWKIKN